MPHNSWHLLKSQLHLKREPLLQGRIYQIFKNWELKSSLHKVTDQDCVIDTFSKPTDVPDLLFERTSFCLTIKLLSDEAVEGCRDGTVQDGRTADSQQIIHAQNVHSQQMRVEHLHCWKTAGRCR